MKRAEPPDAPNAAIALWFHVGHQRRGVGDPDCLAFIRKSYEPRQKIMNQPEKQEDERVTDLLGLIIGAAGAARFYAYSTSPDHREWLRSRECTELSGFREKAEELSRPYPALRPMLGRLYLAIENLVAQGRGECLPPETYGKVLFSEANPCHAPRCEVQRLADELERAILRLHVRG
jgi:hypothetical protein